MKKNLLALMLLALALITPASAQNSLNEFFKAVKLDRPSEVKRWLERGMDPSAVDDEAQPALLLAAKTKSYAALDALLADRRVDVNQLSPQQENVLMLLALNGDIDQMRKVLKMGAEVNKTGWSPLHYAAAGGHVDAVKLLLEEHAYIDAESENKTTPLMMAARLKHVSAAELLVQEGADPTIRNEAGLTAADYFIRHGETAKAQWMVDQAREFRRKYLTPKPAN